MIYPLCQTINIKNTTMKEIKLKYNNWGELNLSTYVKCKKIIDDKNIEDVDKNVKLISILSGMPENDVWNCSLEEVSNIINALGEINMPKKVPSEIKKIKINDVTYDVARDLKHFSYAQYVDFQTYTRLGDEYLANLLATFIIPHGKKYNDGYDPNEVARIFGEHLSVLTANACVVFFSHKLTNSTKRSLRYFKWMLKLMKKTTKDKTVKDMLQQTVEQMEKLVDTHGSLFLTK